MLIEEFLCCFSSVEERLYIVNNTYIVSYLELSLFQQAPELFVGPFCVCILFCEVCCTKARFLFCKFYFVGSIYVYCSSWVQAPECVDKEDVYHQISLLYCSTASPPH